MQKTDKHILALFHPQSAFYFHFSAKHLITAFYVSGWTYDKHGDCSEFLHKALAPVLACRGVHTMTTYAPYKVRANL